MTNDTLQYASQLLCAIGGVLAIIASAGRIPHANRVGYVGGALVIIGTFGAFHFANKAAAEGAAKAALAGKLQSTKPLLDPAKKIYPTVEIGSSQFFLVQAEQPSIFGHDRVFAFFKENTITVKRSDNQIVVSGKVRDSSGAVIAQLIDNEWIVSAHRSLDRNYSVDAFEVIDSAGDVVLQVKALPDRIQMQGRTFNEDGLGFAFAQRQEDGFGMMATGSQGKLPDVKITPMFRYPSANHLGELAVK